MYYFATAETIAHLNEGGANITPAAVLTEDSFHVISFVNSDGEYVDGAFDITDVTELIADATAYKWGLVLRGAYYETKIGDCSWRKTDGYEIIPIRVFAQQVDVNGNVCEDQFVCGYESHPAVQGNGYGEEKLRKFVLSQSYKQNFMADDMRIREITMGDALYDAIDRGEQYTSFFFFQPSLEPRRCVTFCSLAQARANVISVSHSALDGTWNPSGQIFFTFASAPMFSFHWYKRP